MSFVETALAFKSKLRAASPCGYYEGPEHECFRVCTSRPMGPTNPAFSRNSKPPPLGGGVFTVEHAPCRRTRSYEPSRFSRWEENLRDTRVSRWQIWNGKVEFRTA